VGCLDRPRRADRETGIIRSRVVKSRLLYFTDFHWFPVTQVADDIYGAGQKELSHSQFEMNPGVPRPRRS